MKDITVEVKLPEPNAVAALKKWQQYAKWFNDNNIPFEAKHKTKLTAWAPSSVYLSLDDAIVFKLTFSLDETTGLNR